MSNIDISICMITYFHEEYIGQALDSIFSQKTKYKYEINISDDCSKDNTVEIIKKYQNKYPGIINLNVNKKNLGIASNLRIARNMCQGKYIVSLSGDDYWINDSKLETQVEFLNNNPNYDIVCVKSASRLNSSSVDLQYFPDNKLISKEYLKSDFEKGLCLPMRGMMMKNPLYENVNIFEEAEKISSKVDDEVDEYLIVLYNKKVFCLNILTDVYRIINKENAKNYNSLFSFDEQFNHSISILNKLYSNYGNTVNLTNRYYISYFEVFRHIIYERKLKPYKKIYKTVPEQFRVSKHLSWVIKIPYDNIKWFVNYKKRSKI